MRVPRRFAQVTAVGLIALAMTAVPMSGRVFASHSQASATGKVGILFSDFTTSLRWTFDRDFFKQELHKLDPKVQVIVKDAKNNQTTQQQEATSLLTLGVKALVDVPVDSKQAAQIIRAAHANKPRVPVLAYDRLITGAYEDAYASFNGFQVGVQQGKFLKQHVKKGGTLIEIAGADTDNNAHLFHDGAMSVLQPLVSSGYYKLAYSKFTPKWDDPTAQQECASALTRLNNKVDGVLAANDGMAVACINALKAQGLAGKIPITGQDATVPGLQQILLGNQSMTVYKPIRPLARAAARIVDLWLHHKAYHSGTKTQTGAGKTPSAIIPVITITKANVKRVVQDKYVSRSALCAGSMASVCKSAGI